MTKFAVGQTWVTRAGKTVVIVDTEYPSNRYPIFGRMTNENDHVCGRTFTEAGTYLGGEAHEMDLIRLVEPVHTNTVIAAVGEVKPVVAPVTMKPTDPLQVLQNIIDAGRTSRPTYEGGRGSNMVYITPEMYAALNHFRFAAARGESPEKLRKIELERDVFRAVLEGMGFSEFDKMVERAYAVDHARELGREVSQIALEIRTRAKGLSK